ncbi:hypothetical protein VCHA50P417_100080 [Vibrio chagasii]|nr:hypothetical protein VCHA50P417_100080 [Vibrio chagasii]CAH6941028.1 hypothetical protein VCHA48P442_100080 [Vibrio chagasii]CAH7114581.1 hypothetical protein VCHA35O142_90080 [Vibrio chagasii]
MWTTAGVAVQALWLTIDANKKLNATALPHSTPNKIYSYHPIKNGATWAPFSIKAFNIDIVYRRKNF